MLTAKLNKVKRRWFVVSRINGIELHTMAETKAESIKKYLEWMDGTLWGKQNWAYWVKHREAKCLKLKMTFEICH